MSINIGGDILSSSGYTVNSQIVNNPEIVTDGLVFWIDPGNLYSYAGYNSNYYDCYYEDDAHPNRGCQHFSSDPGCYKCGDVLLDISGNGADARKAHPGVTVGYSDIGAYIDFPGSSTHYLSCHRPNYLEHAYNRPDDTGEITIMAWVRPEVYTSGNIVNCGFNTGYRCRVVAGGNLWFYVSGNNIQGGNVPLNQWSHVCLQGSASGLSQYVNMVDAGSNSTAFNPSSKSYLLIGCYNSTSELWNGQMGPIMIYDRVLSYEERLHNYRAGLRRFSNDTIIVPTPSITPSITPTPSPSPVPIVLSYGSTTVLSSSGTEYSAYRPINRTNHSSPNIITINMSFDLTLYASTSYISADISYSINSTTSWTYVDGTYASSFTQSNTLTGTFNITNVDYDDVIRIRLDLNAGVSGPVGGSANATITGGSITSGSGTVTTGSPTDFTIYL